MAKTKIGIRLVSEQFKLYSVTFDGRVPGDSPRDTRQRAIADARSLVKADPDYRELDIEGE